MPLYKQNTFYFERLQLYASWMLRNLLSDWVSYIQECILLYVHVTAINERRSYEFETELGGIYGRVWMEWGKGQMV